MITRWLVFLAFSESLLKMTVRILDFNWIFNTRLYRVKCQLGLNWWGFRFSVYNCRCCGQNWKVTIFWKGFNIWSETQTGFSFCQLHYSKKSLNKVTWKLVWFHIWFWAVGDLEKLNVVRSNLFFSQTFSNDKKVLILVLFLVPSQFWVGFFL